MKVARLQMNLSQKELGACVGLHGDTIYLLEKTSNNLSIDYILKLEKVLNIPLCIHDEYCSFASNTQANIKNIRNKLQLTRIELATLLKLSYDTVKRWERGTSYISRSHYELLKANLLEKAP